MLYELATLSLKLNTINQALPRLADYADSGTTHGRLVGAWETEHGVIITRLLVLREFDDAQQLAHERSHLFASDNPFGIGEFLDAFTAETYRQFPFLDDSIQTGTYGPVYEFRTYQLKIGGLAPTIAGWEAALPERAKLFPLTTVMYAVDGRPRITHIWPFPSLDERLAIRRKAVDLGIWPPVGGPENIAHATSTIAIPASISPLK
ncbi:NIPSNAP family protein [Gordonia sp. ABSL11-1]|uniref:NIPSNAP family protein n=1 Tax=Gordonia sp. ABSL11-1 TaxID=3053924 RepID=UPI0025734CFC|nr:NIPSNAP family protein [Gordonia sp. ABSL11-1]MDL9948167.1 NIPSNAP family protein [Gordonia sp. ABSL11-1]